MPSIKNSETTLTTADGIELYVQTWAPAQRTSAKAKVLLIHGYLEHCGRYNEFSEALVYHNIQVTALDLRGHGKSSGKRGFIKKWSDYHQDISTVLARLDTAGTPCFVLGHSNGGLLALDYFHNNKSCEKIKGVIVTSPFLKAATELGWFKVFLCKALGVILPKLTIPSDVKSSDLTHDQAITKANDEDPLVLKNISLSWANQAAKTQARVLAFREFALPLLFVYAVDDKIANAETNQKYAQALKQVDLTILPRHNEYHEVLNELKRKELYHGTIVTWIMERL